MSPSSPPTGAPPTNSAGTAAAAAADAVACAPTAASSCRITWHMQHPRQAKITTGLSRTNRPTRSAGASPSPAGSMVRPSRPPTQLTPPCMSRRRRMGWAQGSLVGTWETGISGGGL
uniref:Uncharacterized protein n=1 Tax=Zea mays TaxID=4577 RepID=B8A216_MAIZE|nr:unknown [Zea mays]